MANQNTQSLNHAGAGGPIEEVEILVVGNGGAGGGNGGGGGDIVVAMYII